MTCCRLNARSWRISPAARCTPDLFQVVDRGMFRRQCPNRELGEARDGRENVVEIVGDPPGQAADGVHALRLEELAFQSLVRAHVHEHGADADQFPVTRAHGEHRRQPFSPSLAPFRARAA
jgi:hypothetical protein